MRDSCRSPVTGKMWRMDKKMAQIIQAWNAPKSPPKMRFTLPTVVFSMDFCTKCPIMNSVINGMRNPMQIQTSVTVNPLISRFFEMVSARRSFAK